jgi:hypothetical protein
LWIVDGLWIVDSVVTSAPPNELPPVVLSPPYSMVWFRAHPAHTGQCFLF